MSDEARVPIAGDGDIVVARQRGRELGAEIGFSRIDLALIATAISEVARNIINYAVKGEIVVSSIDQGSRRGIAIIARDDGPGIPDVELALRDGYSTNRGLGLGLPGARRLMDEFEIDTGVGRGTTIKMRKWVR